MGDLQQHQACDLIVEAEACCALLSHAGRAHKCMQLLHAPACPAGVHEQSCLLTPGKQGLGKPDLFKH